MKCLSCGEEIPVKSLKCPKCGVNIIRDMKCMSCGKDIPGQAEKCPECGVEIILG